MGFELSEVKGREPVELKVWIPEAGPDAFCMVYYDPSRYNALVEERVTKDLTTMPAGVIVDAIARFVVSWDLTSNGVPVPITRADIQEQVDFAAVQVPIFKAMMEDIDLGKVVGPSQTSSSGRLHSEKQPRRRSPKVVSLAPR